MDRERERDGDIETNKRQRGETETQTGRQEGNRIDGRHRHRDAHRVRDTLTQAERETQRM